MRERERHFETMNNAFTLLNHLFFNQWDSLTVTMSNDKNIIVTIDIIRFCSRETSIFGQLLFTIYTIAFNILYISLVFNPSKKRAFVICFMRTTEVDRGVHSFEGLSYFLQTYASIKKIIVDNSLKKSYDWFLFCWNTFVLSCLKYLLRGLKRMIY